MEASEAGHTEIVSMLLGAGASLKQQKKVEVYENLYQKSWHPVYAMYDIVGFTSLWYKIWTNVHI